MIESARNGLDPAENRIPPDSRSGVAAAIAAIGAAFLAALCCAGPLIVVVFGVGAGLTSTIETLHPIFTLLAVVLLAVGVEVAYGERSAAGCVSSGSCAMPRDRKRQRVLAWISAVVVLVFLTFPRWSILIV